MLIENLAAFSTDVVSGKAAVCAEKAKTTTLQNS